MESSITEQQVNQSASKLLELIDTASNMINRLREKNRNLEDLRSLSIIHLAQYKDDYESLFDIYHKFKDMLNSDNIFQFRQQEQVYDMGQQANPQLQQYAQQIQQQQQPQYQLVQQQTPQALQSSSTINQSLVQSPSVPPPSPSNIQTIQRMPEPSPIQNTVQQAKARINPKIDVTSEDIERPIDIHVPSPPSPTPPPALRQPNPQESTASVINKVEPPHAVRFSDPAYQEHHNVKLLYALSTDAVVCTVSYSSDGSKFVFANTKTAFIIDAETGDLINKIDMRYDPSINEFNPRCMRFTPDDKYIVLGNDDNNACIFEVQTGKHIATLKQHTKKISSILFTHEGKVLITAGYDKLICLWDMETFNLIQKIDHTSSDISPNDMIVAAAYDKYQTFIAIGFMNGSVGVYDIDFKQPLMLFEAHKDNLMNIAISPFDDSIATGSADNTAKIWVLHQHLAHRTTLSPHKSLVLALAFNPDGPILFTGSKDETIRAWDYKKGLLLYEIDAHKNTVFEISHHPTKSRFVSCSGEGLVCVWEYN